MAIMFNLMARTECFTDFVICMSLKEKTGFLWWRLLKKSKAE